MLQNFSSWFGQNETQKRIEINKRRSAAREDGERSDGSGYESFSACDSAPEDSLPEFAQDRGTVPSVRPPAVEVPISEVPSTSDEETEKLLEKVRELEETKKKMEEELARNNKVNPVTGCRHFAPQDEVPERFWPPEQSSGSKANKGFESHTPEKRQAIEAEFKKKGKDLIPTKIR